MPRARDLAINLGLLLATLTLFFGGSEVFLRVTGLQTTTPQPPLIYENNADPLISYSLKPNLKNEPAFKAAVSTDDLGLRVTGSIPGQPILAVLGDSIAFGHGLHDQDTIPYALAAELPDWTVLNAAVPGYHMGQERALYRQKVAPLNPAAITLIFYWNDFDIDTPWLDDKGILRSQFVAPGGQDCNPVTTGILGMLPGKCWLDNHSAFYKALRKLISRRVSNQQKALDERNGIANPEEDPVTDAKLETYQKQLTAFTQDLPPALPRLFVIWPDRGMHIRSRNALRTMAEVLGWTVLDLYDTFGNRVETLPWDSIHPNEASAKKAAGRIAEEWRKVL